MNNQSGIQSESLPMFTTYGSVLAVLFVNLIILWYAVSISVPHDTIAPPAQIQTVSGTRSTPSGSTTGDSVEVDEALLDLEDFDDWEEEVFEVVNIIDLPDEEMIKSLFSTHCSACHGPGGEGNGPAAEFLLPRPRDFIGSPFRFATMGGNRNQIILDIQRTITQGVPRSAMHGFGGVLSEPIIAGLARYVLNLREQEIGEFLEEEGLDVGMRPPWTPELVARGKELFTTLACNTCHGDGGLGDGINAESLVDFQENPVRPADLTSGLFKTGQNPDDLVRTIMRGVPGTPMVAYEMALMQDNDDETVNVMDAWALVSYIRSLQVSPQPLGRSSGSEIIIESTQDEAMLRDPSHIAWLGVCPTLVEIKPLLQREEHTTYIEVRAIQYADQLALCLDWRDETMDLQSGAGFYPDAMATMFGMSDAVPALPLGLNVAVSDDTDPTHSWHWAADRQWEASTGRPCTSEDIQAARTRGWYLFELANDQANGDFVNPSESETSRVSVVHEQIAFGIGAPRDRASSGVVTAAAWSRGVWRVILVRSLGADDGTAIQFTPEARIPISFAVWNGAKGDNGGNKLLSGWHWLKSVN